MYRAGKHSDLCMMSTIIFLNACTSNIYSARNWETKQNLALGAVAVAKTGTKLQCHKPEIMSHSLLLNTAFVSLFALMEAYGHAVVVIIIFMVRGSSESCLSTVNDTGKVWDVWPAPEYNVLRKNGDLQNHISIGGFALWSPEIQDIEML